MYAISKLELTAYVNGAVAGSYSIIWNDCFCYSPPPPQLKLPDYAAYSQEFLLTSRGFLFPSHNIDTKYIQFLVGIHGTHCNSPSVTNTLLRTMFKLWLRGKNS